MTGDPKGNEPFGRIGERLRTIFAASREESARLSRITRIRLDLTGLKGRRDRLIRGLGEDAYRLLRDGERGIEGLQPLVDEIADCDRMIAGREAEIDGLRRDGTKGTAGGGAQGPSPERP